MDFPNILVVDLETTGDHPRDCGIVEIGAEWLHNGENFEIQCRPRPFSQTQAKAIEVNGCDWIQDQSKPTEHEALQMFLTWAGPGPIIIAGHNPYFDLSFLRESHRVLAFTEELPFVHRVLDMHSLAIPHALCMGTEIPARGFYADAIYEMFGIPPEPKPHRAINGARWEAAALREFLDLPARISESEPRPVS